MEKKKFQLRPVIHTIRGFGYQKKQELSSINSFIPVAVCLTTDPKQALQILRTKASSFRRRLLPHLPLTSMPPFIFTSITCFRRLFLRKCDQTS
jgi:hypothetical protein